MVSEEVTLRLGVGLVERLAGLGGRDLHEFGATRLELDARVVHVGMHVPDEIRCHRDKAAARLAQPPGLQHLLAQALAALVGTHPHGLHGRAERPHVEALYLRPRTPASALLPSPAHRLAWHRDQLARELEEGTSVTAEPANAVASK